MYIFKKYEFDDRETAESRIQALYESVEETDTSEFHHISELGYSILDYGEAVLNDEGEYDIVRPLVVSDKYHVDVLWIKNRLINDSGVVSYPYGWKSKEIDFAEGNGLHTFMGADYQEMKNEENDV